VFFTGLSGAGKSTIANVLMIKSRNGRPAGDTARRRSGAQAPLFKLGFSKEHRDINIRRIGYVAPKSRKMAGLPSARQLAPYDSTRKDVRAMIEHLVASS